MVLARIMAETSSTLFVGDLPPDIHESDFVAAFKPFRGFTTARLRQDKNDRYAKPMLACLRQLVNILLVLLALWSLKTTNLQHMQGMP